MQMISQQSTAVHLGMAYLRLLVRLFAGFGKHLDDLLFGQLAQNHAATRLVYHHVLKTPRTLGLDSSNVDDCRRVCMGGKAFRVMERL